MISCSMHDTDRTANLLGAASLALTDLALDRTAQAGGLSKSSAAALVSLLACPGLSVSELGRRVGLSQPAAARMVDALEADDLVERKPSTVHRRLTAVRPTHRGRESARQLLRERNAPLIDIVSQLDESDQQALQELLEKILVRAYRHMGQAQRICRLCDRDSCTRSAACPVGQAERAEAR
jgi:MarR family transcriptional regulator, negative regulator of the multidrug operon emrRAB